MKVLIEFKCNNNQHKKELIDFLEDIFYDYPHTTDNKQFKVIKQKARGKE